MKHLSIILLCAGLLQACMLNLPDPIADMGYENIEKGPFIKYDKYSVSSDNNGDEIINKGETVGLQVWLKNIGTSAAKQVKATFSTTSAYASSFTPTAQINYGDMAAGSSVDYGYSIYYTNRSYTIQFTISSSTPVGTQIPINISITDESGNTWTESFNVPVEATSAQIVYDKYSVYSDSNGDKIINKGETVTLEVYLKNIGSSTAKGVKATFSTISTYASSFTPTAQVNYGDMAAGNSRYGNTDIRFTISSSTPAGTQIPINISITDENGNTWTESFNVPVEATNAQIVYDKYSVYSDSNGDEIVNNGETVGLQVWLKNIGTSAAKQVKATFSTANPYASSLTPTTQINYGDMAAGSSEMADYNGYSTRYTIQFTISSSMPAGTQIPINISITDESGNTWTESFNVTVVKSIDTTPPNAYSTTTWVYGTQTWSDRIVASPSNCSATEYKVYDGRYYYSWTCAYNNRGNFCPSPWRMPSRSDFSTLVSNTNYTTLISAWGYGGYAKGSSMNEVNSDAYYWSSTQYDNLNAYFLYYYNGGLGVSVYYTYTKDVGMQVRCVKD
jgi:uncharacterized protein (DUF302 family)